MASKQDTKIQKKKPWLGMNMSFKHQTGNNDLTNTEDPAQDLKGN